MRINHNIAALNTYRMLSSNNVLAQKSLEKLSSGLRIVRAGDDAAGLAISEKMRGQIRGLEMASKNAQDGISLIQTAEGALNETHSILQRMRELAVQAANDTNTQTDRQEIQKEISQLVDEIDRISSNTEFNTKKLLNGSINTSVGIGTNAADVKAAKAISSDLVDGAYTVTVANQATVVTISQGAAGIDAAADIKSVGTDALLGEYTIKVSSYDGSNKTATVEVFDRYGTSIGKVTGDPTTDLTVGSGNNTVTIAANAITGTGEAKLTIEKSADFTIKLGSVTIAAAANKTTQNGVIQHGGFELVFDGGITNGDSTLNVTNKALTFHIGSNANQKIKLGIEEMSAAKLGVNAIDVTTQTGANNAITTINTAIELVSAERAKLGAVQNRLEHTINNLGTSSENLTAAESRIRDVDMAKEMMEFTKVNILTQAATAMLAQANQQPQLVLQLLGR